MGLQICFAIILLLITIQKAEAQNSKYNVSSTVFIDGEEWDPQINLVLREGTKFQIKPTQGDTIENLEINVFLTKDLKLLNQEFFEDKLTFNKNFNYSFFRKVKDEGRLDFCFVNKDLKNRDITVNFGNRGYHCDVSIVIFFKKE
jgi:hypothetical protein